MGSVGFQRQLSLPMGVSRLRLDEDASDLWVSSFDTLLDARDSLFNLHG